MEKGYVYLKVSKVYRMIREPIRLDMLEEIVEDAKQKKLDSVNVFVIEHEVNPTTLIRRDDLEEENFKITFITPDHREI